MRFNFSITPKIVSHSIIPNNRFLIAVPKLIACYVSSALWVWRYFCLG